MCKLVKRDVCTTNFIQCCQVQRGTATGIINAVDRAMATVINLPDFVKKLVALGSDRAAVMLEKNVWVIALLKEKQPSVIAVHCTEHTLELSYKDAICARAQSIRQHVDTG